ncbi:MAG TPA: MFS transporter [Pyrinomonadaceae bacterium]|nr:MFS transporter [Pyrinomonadaceae bacterium]
MQTNSAPAESLNQSPQRWWLLALLFVAMLISYVHRGAFSVAAPFMATELHLSKAEIGIILSAFFWVYAFMQIPAGWVVDRFGTRRAYSIGFLFWSLAAALESIGSGVASLIGLRVAIGAGQAITFPASARAVASSFKQRERGTVTGIYLTGVRFGTALVNAFGGWFLARHSWRLFFLMIGIAPLIWLLPWNRFLEKWERPAKREENLQQADEISFLQAVMLLRHRSVLGIFLGFFAYDYVWFVFITWLPGYLALERGFSPDEMAVYSSVPYLPMSAIIIASGFFSDWLVGRGHSEKQVRRWFIIVGLAIGCLIVPAGLVSSKVTAVWLLTISLCGLGICSPNTWTLTQAVCEKKIVGSVTGIQNFGGNIGGIIAPALTGYIAHVTNSFALAFAVAGAVLVVGMLAYAFLIREDVRVSAARA